MPSGDNVLAGDMPRIVARGRRSTVTGNITTTETGVLRLDNVPVRAGRAYLITTNNLNLDTTVSNDIAAARLRAVQATGTGTTASTSSTLAGQWRNTIDDSVYSNLGVAQAFWLPSSDGFLSVLLSAVRINGSGNIVMYANSVSGELIDMAVLDLGTDPGDTGVVI